MAEQLFGTPEEMVKGCCANCTASCLFHPADTDWLCEFCRYNLLENPVEDDNEPSCAAELPADYEVCGTCGFDHAYDSCDPAAYQRMKAAHEVRNDDSAGQR